VGQALKTLLTDVRKQGIRQMRSSSAPKRYVPSKERISFRIQRTKREPSLCMIKNQLEQVWCFVECAEADADTLIVQTALQVAQGDNVVVIGDDTDLYLRCFYIIHRIASPILSSLDLTVFKQRRELGIFRLSGETWELICVTTCFLPMLFLALRNRQRIGHQNHP
jgi:hypothetical protein